MHRPAYIVLSLSSTFLVAAVGNLAAQSMSSLVANPPVPGAPAGVIAFVNVNVVPMDTERVLPNQTVLVEGGWITALGPVSKLPVPADAVRIEGQGQFLIPGLADMHAHLVSSKDSARSERQLFQWLADGVTTIRTMDWLNRTYDPDPAPALEQRLAKFRLQLRARAAAGTLLSPRIYMAGRWMGAENFTFVERDSLGRSGVWRIPLTSIAEQITAYQAAGYDFIKVRLEPSEIFDSVAAVARRVGLGLEGHVPPDVSIERALAVPMKSIEHLTGYLVDPQRTNQWQLPAGTSLSALVAATKRANVWNCPTQEIMAASDASSVALRHQLIKALQDAGAGLLLGTDKVPGKGAITQELKALIEAGLTPYQALATGTRNVAVFLGALAESGTVAAGKRADMVLLSGNPFEDIQHTARPVGVMLGGRWLPREELDRRLAPPINGPAGLPTARTGSTP